MNRQKEEMIEMGVVKYYYDDDNYGVYNGRYEKDCVIFIKLINHKSILLTKINDKMYIIEIGDFQHYGDNFNGKIWMNLYYLKIPSTVLCLIDSYIDK